MDSDFCIKNTRILHFEKFLPYQKAEQGTSLESGKCDGKTEDNQVTKHYLSLGYYDRLTYARAVAPKVFDYRHTFLLKYPYKRTRRQMLTDQMFTLLDTEESVSGLDPFEYQGEKQLPFLGIILVTISGKSDKCLKLPGQYNALRRALDEECRLFIEEKKSSEVNICYKIFYTPNCADLCMVLRTDYFNAIYELKKKIALSEIQWKSEEEKVTAEGICHTISYTVIQPSSENWSEELQNKNENIWLEMRLAGSLDKIKIIQQELRQCGQMAAATGRVHGITGVGQYSIEVDFKTFASVYPILCSLKVPGFWIKDYSADGTTLQKCFYNAHSELECSYIRVKYEPNLIPRQTEILPEVYAGDLQLIKEYKERLSELKKIKITGSLSLRNMILEKEFLLRELLDTYNDFWYRPCSWWKGVLFYAQLESIISGVKKYLNMMEKNQGVIAEKMAKQLCLEMTRAISSVNNFNKLLQSVNQYVVNVPNYEIQTKVNVEKYLIAYTMYLLHISILYKNQMQMDEKIVPFITLDFTADGIHAETLFGNITAFDETGYCAVPGIDGEKRTSFVVTFPNYQWFANIYHVLPMITHEMSHNFRYLDRSSRNDFVLDFLVENLARYITEKILRNERGYTGEFDDNLESFLLKHIRKVLKESIRGENWEKSREYLKLRDFGIFICRNFMRVTGMYEEQSGVSQLWDLLKKEMTRLFAETGMPFVIPEDLTDGCLKKINVYIVYFNVILDALMFGEKPEDARKQCSRWQEKIENLQKENADKRLKKPLKMVEDFLKRFLSDGTISIDDISVAVRSAVVFWINSRDVRKMCRTDARFAACVAELKELHLEEVFSLLVQDGPADTGKTGLMEKLRVTEEDDLYEKLNVICSSYANIVTSFGWCDAEEISYYESESRRFASRLHQSVYEDYQELLEQRHECGNRWLTYKKEQSYLASLGISNPHKEQFLSKYQAALLQITEMDIQQQVYGQLSLYDEIFADMGMCRVFQFSAYGYFMYTIHIFMKQRDVPRRTSRDFTIDRMKALLLSIYREETISANPDEKYRSIFEKKLESYWQDLREYLRRYSRQNDENRCLGVEQLLARDSFFELQENEIIKAIEMLSDRNTEYDSYLEMLRWMSVLYMRLNLDGKRYRKEAASTGKLYEHILSVDRVACADIPNVSWIGECRKDNHLKDIGEYYNEFAFTSIHRKCEEGKCMAVQNEFVFNYYAQMFDRIHVIKEEINTCVQKNGANVNMIDLLFDEQ